MKKLFAIAGFLIFTSSVFAQYYEVTPLAGYTFSGKADNGYATYDFSNSFLYGGRLDVQFSDLSYLELSVRRIEPTVSYKIASAVNFAEFNTGTAHYMAGYLREFSEGEIKPYGVISAGTSRYWTKGDAGLPEMVFFN